MSISSQQFDSYVPVYDALPETWVEARPFLVEQLKMMSNGINIREIGWFLDEELLSGKAFIPGATIPGNNPGLFRQVLRKVFDVSPLVPGLNTKPFDILFDNRFTLIELYVACTNSITLKAQELTDTSVIMEGNTGSGTQNTFQITSPMAFDRAFVICEYLQEL